MIPLICVTKSCALVCMRVYVCVYVCVCVEEESFRLEIIIIRCTDGCTQVVLRCWIDAFSPTVLHALPPRVATVCARDRINSIKASASESKIVTSVRPNSTPACTHLHRQARDDERFQCGNFLRRVAEKLALSLVPLDGVQLGALHVVMADQICIIAPPDGNRNTDAHVLQRDDEICGNAERMVKRWRLS